MKDPFSSTVQILRLLRLAGLMALLGSAAWASAQTVKERLEKDPGFRIYPVILGVTATSSSKAPAIRLVEVGTIKGAPKINNVPDAFINAAKKKIQAHPPELQMKDGRLVETFSVFFYVPGHPKVVVVDLDKPLDQQP